MLFEFCGFLLFEKYFIAIRISFEGSDVLMADTFALLEFLFCLESHRQKIHHLRANVWINPNGIDQSSLLIFFIFKAQNDSINLFCS